MRSLEFTIPGLPSMPNSLLGAHWTKRKKHADQWRTWVRGATLGRWLGEPAKRAMLTLTRYSSVEPDHDGLAGSFKPIIDALVAVGILENDKRENIGVPTYVWGFAKPKAGFIRVLIEEVP